MCLCIQVLSLLCKTRTSCCITCFFFFQAEDGIRDIGVTGVQTCALPISTARESLLPNSPETSWTPPRAMLRQPVLLKKWVRTKRRFFAKPFSTNTAGPSQKVNQKIFPPRLTKFSHPLESSLLFLVKLRHA